MEHANYTATINAQMDDIFPDDEDYERLLLEAVENFRSFGQSLDTFLLKKGLNKEYLDNTDKKCAFIRSHFKEAGILSPRTPQNWFLKSTGINAESVPDFAFAFHMDMDEITDFCRRISFTRGIDSHTLSGAIDYFCLYHHYPYSMDRDIKDQLEKIKSDSAIPSNGCVKYTRVIVDELQRLSSPDELIHYLSSHYDQFKYNNATAHMFISTLWEQITRPDGLITQETQFRKDHNLMPDIENKSNGYTRKIGNERNRSTWPSLLFILGLSEDYVPDASSQKRSLTPILSDSQLIHELAKHSFPDRQIIEKIVRGEHAADESMRKLLILLQFYCFCVERVMSRTGNFSFYNAEPDEEEACIDEINNLLIECNYPTLYPGNPYDWIFLFSLRTQTPLETFREYMLIIQNEQENESV